MTDNMKGWMMHAHAVAALILLGFGCLPAQAQAPAPPVATTPFSSMASTAQANAGVVGVVSGGVSGTYIRIAADLAAVLDDGDRLRVLPLVGKGSVQNVSDILLLRGIDIGIVQSDVLAYVRRQRSMAGVERSVQYITKLYDEEVHILARRDIASLSDLAGKPVNIDVAGSGTSMTASVLFETLGVQPGFTNDNQGLALEKLKRGEIAALVYVAGKPASLFAGLGSDSGLHFLAISATPSLLETYLPAELDSAQYPQLVPSGETVDTIAVGAVMAVYAWQPQQERYGKVARFVDAFFSRFPSFRQPPQHPKWQEVNLGATLPGWTRFPAAQDWLRVHSLTPPTPPPTGTTAVTR
jgi:TRAP transporter TAXI family solute receptor